MSTETGFEASFGGWTTSTFSRTSGSTSSSSTGPNAAAEGSYFVYAETSSPNHPNKQFTMYQNFNETMSIISAVTFDYHMYGSDMGTVLLQGSVDGSSYMTFWSRTGNAGNAWYQANVTVDQSAATGYYKWLRFHYTSGSSYRGDLALDNVAVETRVSTNSTPAPTTEALVGTQSPTTEPSSANDVDDLVPTLQPIHDFSEAPSNPALPAPTIIVATQTHSPMAEDTTDSPTTGDMVSLAIAFTLTLTGLSDAHTLTAAPTTSEKASLKAVLAAMLEVAEDGIRDFHVAATWEVRFCLSVSLSAQDMSSAAEAEAALESWLTGAAFQEAVSEGVRTGLTVMEESVVVDATAHLETAAPSPTPANDKLCAGCCENVRRLNLRSGNRHLLFGVILDDCEKYDCEKC